MVVFNGGETQGVHSNVYCYCSSYWFIKIIKSGLIFLCYYLSRCCRSPSWTYSGG